MASPFTVFRKHQRMMIATLAIMAMIAFVFLDPRILDSLGLRGTSAQTDPIVVTSSYGNLRHRSLEMLVYERRAVVNFLVRLNVEAEPPPQGVDPEQFRRYREQFQEMRVRQVRQRYEQALPANPRDVANTWLLAQRAEQLGVVVNDQTINNFIQANGGDRLEFHQVKAIIGSLRLNQRQLFNALQTELLAVRLKEMFGVSTAAITPAQRWDYFQRLKRMAVIELAAVPVEQYVGQVKDPDDSVLKEFFELHKDRLYDPQSPEPGFREPHRIAIEYFKAEREKFIDPKSVSDEDVRKYYEEHKKTQFVKTPVAPATEKPPVAPPAPAKAAAEAGKTPAAAPAPPKPAAEVKKPALPDKKPETGKKADSAGKSSAVMFAARVQFTADQQPGGPPEPAAKKADSEKKAAPKPESVPPAAEKKAPAKPGPEKSGPEKSGPVRLGPVKRGPVKLGPVKAGPVKPATEKNVVAAQQPAAPPPAVVAKEEYRPLEEVQNEIRKTLAAQRVGDKILAVFTPLRDKLNHYTVAKLRYDADVKKNSALTPPATLDLAALAQQAGLSFATTGLISRWDARNLEIGKSIIGGAEPFLLYAFRTLPKNRPVVAEDARNYYLFWEVKDDPEHVAEFGDAGIRATVLRQWKMVQARKLAIDEAQGLAGRARQSHRPLPEEALKGQPGLKVIETRPFSWLSTDANPDPYARSRPQPRLSVVDGVDLPDGDFMRAVFALEPGGVAVAWNHPRTSAYVVRAVQFTPLPSKLREDFKHDTDGDYRAVAQEDQARTFAAWMEEIQKAAAFKYTPTAEEASRPESHEEGPAPLSEDADY